MPIYYVLRRLLRSCRLKKVSGRPTTPWRSMLRCCAAGLRTSSLQLLCYRHVNSRRTCKCRQETTMMACIFRVQQRTGSLLRRCLPSNEASSTQHTTTETRGALYCIFVVLQYHSKYIYTALSPVSRASATAAPEAAPAAPPPPPLPETDAGRLLLPLPLPASVRLARRSVLQRGQQGSRARSNHSSMHCCMRPVHQGWRGVDSNAGWSNGWRRTKNKEGRKEGRERISVCCVR